MLLPFFYFNSDLPCKKGASYFLEYLFHEHSAGAIVVSLDEIEAESLIELNGLCLFLFIDGIKSDFFVAFFRSEI